MQPWGMGPGSRRCAALADGGRPGVRARARPGPRGRGGGRGGRVSAPRPPGGCRDASGAHVPGLAAALASWGRPGLRPSPSRRSLRRGSGSGARGARRSDSAPTCRGTKHSQPGRPLPRASGAPRAEGAPGASPAGGECGARVTGLRQPRGARDAGAPRGAGRTPAKAGAPHRRARHSRRPEPSGQQNRLCEARKVLEIRVVQPLPRADTLCAHRTAS